MHKSDRAGRRRPESLHGPNRGVRGQPRRVPGEERGGGRDGGVREQHQDDLQAQPGEQK